MTLCFSQQHAAAVYAATKGTKEGSVRLAFVGRLDDIGQNGMDVVKNIKRMFSKGDGHVLVLAASIRSLEHLLYCFALETELATVPAKTLKLSGQQDFSHARKTVSVVVHQNIAHSYSATARDQT